MTTFLALLTLAVLLLLGVRLWRTVDAHRGPDWGGPWLNRLDGLNRLLCRRYHRLPAVWLPLPDRGPVLLASNHVSGLDPLLLVAASRRPLRFLIAREQYERRGLQWLFRAAGCIPVDRAARPEQALRAALRALQAGEAVALFPHGRIHLESDPPRALSALGARPGRALRARNRPAEPRPPPSRSAPRPAVRRPMPPRWPRAGRGRRGRR